MQQYTLPLKPRQSPAPPLPSALDAGFDHGDTAYAGRRPAPVERRLSAGLYPSLWPCDHGDTARRKFVVEGGLPADLRADLIKVFSNPELPYPQWFYTRERDELFVYGVPVDIRGLPYFARVDARTLEVRQKRMLPRILYIGGALMHRNGDVYLVHGPTLTRFRGGDLEAATTIALPRENGMFTQYNGMTVAEDGNLLLKGWSMTVREAVFFRWPLTVFALSALLCLTGATLLYTLAGVVLGAVLPLALAPAAPVLLLLAKGWMSGASWWEFLRPKGTGFLLVFDPGTLEVLHKTAPPERVAYARMAMTRTEQLSGGAGSAEWLITPGDEHILRWRYEGGRLTFDPVWSERYRTWGDGSFAGTGPATHDGQVYYTDNTAPVGLARGYHLFRKDLSGGPQQTRDLCPDGPGFMFFSTVIDPARQNLVVWDTEGGSVEARALSDLSLSWRARLYNTDCVAVAADRGHVYATDHSEGLPGGRLLESVGRRPRWSHIEKSFVVLDAHTGRERLRVSLGKGSPVMAMIVPGMNDDVFVSTRRGLVRVAQT